MGNYQANTQYTEGVQVDSSPLNLKLNKKVYGLNGAVNTLDREFKEFKVLPKDYKEFFLLWNTNFYDLKRGTHSYFLGKSANYAYPEGMPKNGRLLEITDLKEQLRSLQREIDSKEKEHFFFKNHTFLVLEGSDRLSGGQLSNIGPQIGPYYLQSGKKRLVNNLDLYFKLKTKTRKYGADILDKDFLVFLNNTALGGIPDGPPITGTNDIYIDTLEINIYPQTLNEYNNSPINQLLGMGQTELTTLNARD